MSVEIDIISHQILNRNKLSQRHLHHKLTIPAPAPSSEPLVQSVRELWDAERARRTAIGLNPTPELPGDGNASQRGLGARWEQEPLFWEQLRARMVHQNTEANVVQGWEKWVMTAFESVEALWEEGWKTWAPQLSGTATDETARPASQINPFGSTQVEQDPEHENAPDPRTPDAKRDAKLGDVDEDIAAGQALQNLVIAAEEADWHDEQWDELLYDDELREMATQGTTSREISVPSTPMCAPPPSHGTLC